MFSLTLILTAVLLGRDIPAFWWVLISVYLVGGVLFVTIGVMGFARLRRKQASDLEKIKNTYV